MTTPPGGGGNQPAPLPLMFPLRESGTLDATRGRQVAQLFAVTLFVGSGLVFLVQPMFAKMALPLLGGSPSVWNTCVVFFQAALLAGYVYAHWLTSRISPRQQVIAHAALLLAIAFTLPIAIPAGWEPPVESSPIPWLLGVLIVAVGAPFFVISSTAPLLQKWFSSTDHPSAADPYFLYSASNVGSILALLGYPLLIEPAWTLSEQNSMWAAGYAGLAALILTCGVVSLRNRMPATQVGPAPADDRAAVAVQAVDWPRRARWVALSFVPSSLMLAVTTYVTTDIAAVPLLWTVPLSLYLLSFVLGFASRQYVPLQWHRIAMIAALVPLIVTMALGMSRPATLIVPLHLITFFVCAWLLHRVLAADRPHTRHLTEFYLWIAVGGVLGGAFNTFAAPLLFTTIVEYPLALALAVLLHLPKRQESRRFTASHIAIPVLAATATAATLIVARISLNVLPISLLVGFGLTACTGSLARPVRIAAVVAAILAAGSVERSSIQRLVAAERTFFGVLRVRVDTKRALVTMLHGSTLHGVQSLDRDARGEPLSYYSRSGPIGQLFDALSAELESGRIGVAGLGAGTLAAYARPHQQWTFFEIDPAVERFARNREHFTYLERCASVCRIVLGDARLSLVRSEAASFDLLVFDAFSSDAIPVHLVTREALDLYLSRLANDGVLAFHISNRHLDLRPILGALAAEHGLFALTQVHTADTRRPGESRSMWLVMARSREALGRIAQDTRWRPPVVPSGTRVWTDDYSDILSTLRAKSAQ